MFRKILILLITAVLVFGISSFSIATMCHGQESQHSSHQQITQTSSGQKHEADATTHAMPKEPVNVGNKICPVSGDKINEKSKATYEYEGKIYNFCCPMCIEEFKKNPEKYIKKIEEQKQKEIKEGAEKSSGMHKAEKPE